MGGLIDWWSFICFVDGQPLDFDERMELSDVDDVKDAKLVIRDLQYTDKGKWVEEEEEEEDLHPKFECGKLSEIIIK